MINMFSCCLIFNCKLLLNYVDGNRLDHCERLCGSPKFGAALEDWTCDPQNRKKEQLEWVRGSAEKGFHRSGSRSWRVFAASVSTKPTSWSGSRAFGSGPWNGAWTDSSCCSSGERTRHKAQANHAQLRGKRSFLSMPCTSATRNTCALASSLLTRANFLIWCTSSITFCLFHSFFSLMNLLLLSLNLSWFKPDQSNPPTGLNTVLNNLYCLKMFHLCTRAIVSGILQKVKLRSKRSLNCASTDHLKLKCISKCDLIWPRINLEAQNVPIMKIWCFSCESPVNQRSLIFVLASVMMLWNRKYQEFDVVVSSVTTKVKGVAQTNLSGVGEVVWDVVDYSGPAAQVEAQASSQDHRGFKVFCFFSLRFRAKTPFLCWPTSLWRGIRSRGNAQRCSPIMFYRVGALKLIFSWQSCFMLMQLLYSRFPRTADCVRQTRIARKAFWTCTVTVLELHLFIIQDILLFSGSVWLFQMNRSIFWNSKTF